MGNEMELEKGRIQAKVRRKVEGEKELKLFGLCFCCTYERHVALWLVPPRDTRSIQRPIY